jgi:hypothetical protein
MAVFGKAPEEALGRIALGGERGRPLAKLRDRQAGAGCAKRILGSI